MPKFKLILCSALAVLLTMAMLLTSAWAAQADDQGLPFRSQDNDVKHFGLSPDYIFQFGVGQIDLQYNYLFEPDFFYKAHSTGRKLSITEMTYFIAHAQNTLGSYTQQPKATSTAHTLEPDGSIPQNLSHPKWNSLWLYRKALSIYTKNGIKSPTKNENYTLHYSRLPVYIGKTRYPYYGTTPLHMAVLKKDALALTALIDMIKNHHIKPETKKLQSRGHLDINTQDALGHTALHLAMRIWATFDYPQHKGYAQEFILPLLEAGADPNSINTRGESILHHLMRLHSKTNFSNRPYTLTSEQAAKIVSVELSAELRVGPPDWFLQHLMPKFESQTLNSVDLRGHTPLIKLALSQPSEQTLQMLKLFVARGAHIDATDGHGRDIRRILLSHIKTDEIQSRQPGKVQSAAQKMLQHIVNLRHKLPPRHESDLMRGGPNEKYLYQQSRAREEGPKPTHPLYGVIVKKFSPTIMLEMNRWTPSDEQRDFLRLVYLNKADELQKFLADLGPELQDVIDFTSQNQATLIAARNNFAHVLQHLLALPQPQQALKAQQIINDSLSIAIARGSLDAVQLLVNAAVQTAPEPKKAIQPYLSQAAQAGRLPILRALLHFSFDLEYGNHNTPTPMPYSYFFHSFLLKTEQSFLSSLNRMSRDEANYINSVLADSLIPALYSRNEDLIRYVLALSPKAFEQRSNFNNNVFHIAVEIPQPQILADLLYYYRAHTHPPTKISPHYTNYTNYTRLNFSHPRSIHEILKQTDRRGDSVLINLAWAAGSKPEHINAYQNMFSQLMEALAHKKHEHSPNLDAASIPRVLSPKDATLFMEKLEQADRGDSDTPYHNATQYVLHPQELYFEPQDLDADVATARQARLDSWHQLLNPYVQLDAQKSPLDNTELDGSEIDNSKLDGAEQKSTTQCAKLLAQADKQ